MKRILVVEPDEALRTDLRRTLEGAGYAVDDASSCAEAGRPLRRGRPDALLVGLDDSSDLAPLTRLLESPTTPPVLALVTPRSLALSLALSRCGVRAVLRKPFDLDELESELAAALAFQGRAHTSPVDFITRDPATLRSLRLAEAVATRNTTLVIEGESGTGKTLLANRVHRASPRRRAIRRIELDDDGAATQAALRSAENAGTLLLPGIHRASAGSQEVLLDWLQHVPASADHHTESPRIVATTHYSLAEAVERGELRPDLAHRLDVVTLKLPPLRERLCDVPALIRHFAGSTGRLSEDSIFCPPEALALLADHPFRGNVRELENRIHRLATLGLEEPIDARRLLEPDPASTRREATRQSLKDLEREAIESSLARHDNNRTQASRELGISVRTLRNKLQRYGLA